MKYKEGQKLRVVKVGVWHNPNTMTAMKGPTYGDLVTFYAYNQRRSHILVREYPRMAYPVACFAPVFYEEVKEVLDVKKKIRG